MSALERARRRLRRQVAAHQDRVAAARLRRGNDWFFATGKVAQGILVIQAPPPDPQLVARLRAMWDAWSPVRVPPSMLAYGM